MLRRSSTHSGPTAKTKDLEPTFSCSQCDKVFNTKRGLTAHVMHGHKTTKTSTSAEEHAAEIAIPVEESTEDSSPTLPAPPAQEPPSKKHKIEKSPAKVQPTNEISTKAAPVAKTAVENEKPKVSSPSVVSTGTTSNRVTPLVSAIIARVAGLEAESEEPEDEEAEPDILDYSRDYEDDDEQEAEDTDVEHYACKFCKDRIFLTSFGLERHTKLSHPTRMEEALNEIKRIQAEKERKAEARRAVESTASDTDEQPPRSPSIPEFDFASSAIATKTGRPPISRDRYSTESPRYRFINRNAEKESDPAVSSGKADSGEVFQMARRQRAAIVASASFTEPRPTGRHKRSLDAPKAKYQSCDICGILINTEHPKAMESHTKAHQKNQELRQELLRLYGPSWVDNVTCRECNLVFKDEEKLDQHRRNVHVRRRHFLCRFCGDVFRNMRDLNMHKERRHEAFEGHRRNLDNTSEFVSPAQPFRRPTTVSTNRASANATSGDAALPNSSSGGDNGNVEEFSCRTVCEVCGLQMVRPSNLIRHMKQSHDKMNFTATVETRGMPPFKIDVFDGQFMWGCCDEVYDDRQAFINHRRLAHGPSYVGNPKECDHCGLSFKNNVSYINHLRTHRPRVCHICGESFGNTASDLTSYRSHMLKHRDQGYNIRFSQIDDELTQDENQDLWRAIEEEEADDESEDDYSIFSESGVESDGDENSDLNEEDDGTLLTSCPICDKKFACIYRFGDHWSLHCKRAALVNGLDLKTKPFRYDATKRLDVSTSCSICRRKFKTHSSLALHYLNCFKKRFGVLPKEDDQNIAVSSPSKNVKHTPTKYSEAALSTDNGVSEKDLEMENVSRELEDSLDVGAKEKRRALPLYVEKAYVVEWHTNKVAPEHPYLCRTCDQPFGDFLSLIMHVKTHIEHPIYEDVAQTSDKSKATSSLGVNENQPDAHKASDVSLSVDESIAHGKTLENGFDDEEGVLKIQQLAEPGENDNSNLKSSEKDETVRACVLRIRTSGTLTVGKHACAICSRRFADNDALDEHVHLTHSLRKQHFCRLCGQKFWTADGLNDHNKRHDANNYYCSICDKRFTNLDTLSKHETVHELTNSLYQCEDCSLSFFGLEQLQNHFKGHHEGVSILTCPVCARIHTDAETLQEHFDSEHSGTRTHCSICSKNFKTPMQAKRHVKVVHLLCGRDSAFSCTLCGKQFNDRYRLALHLWRHTGSKKYQCRLCDTGFDTDEGVREHLEIVHEISWVDSRDLIIDNHTVFNEEAGLKTAKKCFSCYICARRFDSKASVQTHVNDVHKRMKKPIEEHLLQDEDNKTVENQHDKVNGDLTMNDNINDLMEF